VLSGSGACNIEPFTIRTIYAREQPSAREKCGARHLTVCQRRGCLGRWRGGILGVVRRAALLGIATLLGAGVARAEPAILYVNFSDGSESLQQGQVDDATRDVTSMGSIPRYPPFTWPGINDGSISRRDLIRAITRQVNDLYLPYNLLVTTTRPAAGPYTMVMVGGTPTVLGYDARLAGVAFMDCDNLQPANIVFAFPSALRGNVHGLVVTIAQEAAHSYGLEHSMDPTDIMYPKVDPAQREFPDRAGPIAGDHLCGRDTQNPHRRLLETLGPWPGGPKPLDDLMPPDTDPPTVVIREPGAAAGPVPQPFTLRATVDDDSTIVEVTVEAVGSAGAARYSATRGPYAWSLAGFPPGPLTVKVTAVDTAGNRGETSLALTVGEEAAGGCSVARGGTNGAGLLILLVMARLWQRTTCPARPSRL
jgi:hypothetical protein